MKQVNIITVILFAFLFISCQNKKLSKIESRTRFLIQKSTEKENCSISYDSCVFQNDSICIVDYILIKEGKEHPKEYVYYNSSIGEMVSIIDLNKKSSLISFVDSAKNELENIQPELKLTKENLIIYATMMQIMSKGGLIVEE